MFHRANWGTFRRAKHSHFNKQYNRGSDDISFFSLTKQRLLDMLLYV